MAFEPNKWADGVEGETPITAAELNRIEAAGAAPSWASVTGKPSTFAPATHSHVIGDVTGLQAALDATAAASALADLVARVQALEDLNE